VLDRAHRGDPEHRAGGRAPRWPAAQDPPARRGAADPPALGAAAPRDARPRRPDSRGARTGRPLRAPASALDAKQIDEATWWQNPEFELEPRLVLGSAEEEQFVKEWLPTRLGPAAARWFIPQAPLDALAAGSGVPAAGQRRLDFLALRPDGEKLAIEIDGGQHADAELIDDDRDALLASAGVPVTRITVDELRAGMGLGLDEVSRFCAGQDGAAPGDTYARLVWAPVQVHRLVLALIEALQTGFLTGERWVIEVDDPLEVAVELLEPYLDLFLAADRLWAGDAVAGEIVVGAPGSWRRYLATDEGFARAELEFEPDTADVLVRLEGDRASTDRLEPRVDGPEIVVRSARLPVNVADPVYEGSGRIAARSEGEQIEWALRVMLQSIFAKEDFREGQLDALIEVIEGGDCAVRSRPGPARASSTSWPGSSCPAARSSSIRS